VNWKLVSAFVSGALIASGIVYLAVKPDPVTKPAVESASLPTPVPAPPPLPPPSPIATTARPVVPAPVPEPVARRAPTAPRPRFREKPSPMPPPSQRERNVTVARNVSLAPLEPAVNLPAPASAPVVQAPVPQAPVEPPPAPTPAPEPVPTPTPAVSITAAPEIRTPHVVTLAAGTTLAVRIGETISSARCKVGDRFLATLEQQLVIDGFIIAERGARMEGRVSDVTQAARGVGSSHLEIVLVKLETADRQNVRIRTVPYKKDATSSAGSDVAKVGAGTVLGAAIGAIAGGGKGAAIGAGAGAAAGGGAVLLTRGKSVEIPVETRLSFRVQDPVTITEKLD